MSHKMAISDLVLANKLYIGSSEYKYSNCTIIGNKLKSSGIEVTIFITNSELDLRRDMNKEEFDKEIEDLNKSEIDSLLSEFSDNDEGKGD